MTTLYLSASSDAIDAALVTKDRAVEAFLRNQGIPPQSVAAIGDSVNDLPFLMLPDLGLRGAPANAQPEVLERLRDIPNSVVLKESVTEGFLHFYRAAADLQMSYIFADRDGVLIWEVESEPQRLALMDVFRQMGGSGKPFVVVLTGSSYEQNLRFMKRHGLDSSLRANPAVLTERYVVWAENGALQINVLDHTFRIVQDFDQRLLSFVKGQFQAEVLERLDREVLPAFGFAWSESPADKNSGVFVPPKRTMFTVDVPKMRGDHDDYRRTPNADAFRKAVLDIMKQVAEEHGVAYVILS